MGKFIIGAIAIIAFIYFVSQVILDTGISAYGKPKEPFIIEFQKFSSASGSLVQKQTTRLYRWTKPVWDAAGGAIKFGSQIVPQPQY